MPTRTPGRDEGQHTQRILDPRRHFLGLLKDGAVYIFCRECRRFLRCVKMARHLTANRSPSSSD